MQSQSQIESYLLKTYGEETLDLFASTDEKLRIAYKKRATRVAYRETGKQERNEVKIL